MKCTRCYDEIPQGATFCAKCGAPVQIQPQYQQPQYQQAQYQQAQYQQSQYQQAQYQQPQYQQPQYQQVQYQQPQYQQPQYQQSQYQQSQYQQPQYQQPQYQQSQYQQPTYNTYGNTVEAKKSKSKKVIIGVYAALIMVLLVMVGVLVSSLTSKDDKADNNGNQVADNGEGNGTADGGNADDGGNGNGTNTAYEDGTRTIMVYMIGSDLESKYGAGTLDISEMMEAEFDEDIRVVIQTGGALDWQTDYIKDGEVQRFEVRDNQLFELESLGKVNMSLGETLEDFITYASDKYPAEKYTLVLWDHGGSIPVSFGYDEVFNTGLISEADLGKALKSAGVKFESIIMDACNMCTLEVAMAIKDYADYFVAAESVVIGTGLYYTGWLDYLGENESAEPSAYCEVIIKNYMDTAQKQKADASMSSIDLSKIENVYNAYIAYIEGVYEEVSSGDYVDYVKAREACGLYSGTESVDLITLAKKYKTTESSALIKAVKEAVLYTDSDYVYGNGLAAYSPNERSDVYEDARISLETLEYDDCVLKCYDAVVSLKLAYMGKDYVNSYAGQWYDDEIVRYYMADSSQSQTYELETQKVGGYDALCLTEDDWDILSTMTVTIVIYMDDNNAMILGREYYYENIDSEGNVILLPPECWTYINGYIVSYVCVNSYEDEETGEWMQLGTVFARVNGEEVLLMLQYDNDNPYGDIIGYVPYDFETQQSPQGRARIMTFNPDDEVELIHPIIEVSSKKIYYDNVLEEVFKASELELAYDYIDYTGFKVACQFEITDIYGNEYKTDEFEY